MKKHKPTFAVLASQMSQKKKKGEGIDAFLWWEQQQQTKEG